MTAAERKKVAFRAERIDTGKRVWVVDRLVRVDDSPPFAGRVRATARWPSVLQLTGPLTLGISVALFAAGGKSLADAPAADVSGAQCRQQSGYICFDGGLNRVAGGIFLGVGAVAAALGAVQVWLGQRRSSSEIKPNERGFIYVE